jgi:serine/threonine protein kinase
VQYFHETIENWDDWGKVFQSIPAFTPLAEEIFRRHHLPFLPLRHLTPGTNGVFLSGEYVIKIYAPKESGIEPEQNELPGLAHAGEQGVCCPEITAWGMIHDRYDFYYLIMKKAEGTEAGTWLKSADYQQKITFAQTLREQTQKMNHLPKKAEAFSNSLFALFQENHRWNDFPRSLQQEIAALTKAEDEKHNKVFVHGDLTGENILVTSETQIQIIDFGDCRIAPFWYEWPPLVNELFGWDPLLIQTYFSGWTEQEFFSTLSTAMLCHDFGGDMLKGICDHLHVSYDCIASRKDTEQLLKRKLYDKTRKDVHLL